MNARNILRNSSDYREGRIKPPQSKLGPKKVNIQIFEGEAREIQHFLLGKFNLK